MIRLVQVEQTCGACPSQWEGTDTEHRPVYIRYRHGYLSVRIGPVDGDIGSAVDGEEILGTALGDALDGVLSEEELREVTKAVLEFP